jgi:hypothetical protein
MTSSTGSNAAAGGEAIHEAEHPGRLTVNDAAVAVESAEAATCTTPPRPLRSPRLPHPLECSASRASHPPP